DVLYFGKTGVAVISYPRVSPIYARIFWLRIEIDNPCLGFGIFLHVPIDVELAPSAVFMVGVLSVERAVHEYTLARNKRCAQIEVSKRRRCVEPACPIGKIGTQHPLIAFLDNTIIVKIHHASLTFRLTICGGKIRFFRMPHTVCYPVVVAVQWVSDADKIIGGVAISGIMVYFISVFVQFG